jgi:putative addiction module killer protein
MRSIRTTDAFSTWLAGLRDAQARVRIQLRIDRAELGNYGDCQSVGEGVSEMRIHYGPGYRVYFVERGQIVTILLAGGTKKSQSRDIKQAKLLAGQV